MTGKIAAANPNASNLGRQFGGMETGRLERLLGRLGFIEFASVEFDLVFHNIANALKLLRLCSGGFLPDDVDFLDDEINRLLSIYPLSELAIMARGSRSSFASDPNPIRGHYLDFPFCAVVSIPETSDTAKFYAGLGILLLSRMASDATILPTQLENDAATGLRKCFTSPRWQDARDLFPQPNEKFIDSLRDCKRLSASKFLSDPQQDFFRSFSNLLESQNFQILNPRRAFRYVLSDEPHDAQLLGVDLRLQWTKMPAVVADLSVTDQDDLPLSLLQLAPDTLKPGQGEDIERRRLIDVAHSFISDNQFLPHRWHSLTREEVKEIARLANDFLRNYGNEPMAIVGALVLLTGQHPEELADFVIAESLDIENIDLPWSRNYLDLSNGCWWHTGSHLPNSYCPSPNHLPFLKKHSRWISLALPDTILNSLRSMPRLPTGRLADVLHMSEENLVATLTTFCSEIRRQAPWVRAFPARLRRQSFDWWVSKTSDDTLASLSSSVTEYAPTAPLYYFAQNVEELQSLHLERLSEMGWPPQAAKVVLFGTFGARLQPTKASVDALIEHLTGQIEAARQAYLDGPVPATIAGLHNAIAIYTMTLLIFGTGHRKAVEYCFSSQTMSLDDYLVVLADKIISSENASRLVALPMICISQVRAYFDHLELLAARVTRYAPGMATRIRSIFESDPLKSKLPMLGLLSPDLAQWKGLSVSILQDLLGNIWPLPLNAPRNILASEARKADLSPEYNHYRAGHIGLGQNPWSHWSPLVPAEVLEESASIADQLLNLQGWTVQRGIEGRARNPTSLELRSDAQCDPPYRLLPLERAQATISSQTRQLLRAVIKKASARRGELKFSGEDIAEMRQEILEGASGDAIIAATALNLLSRWIKRNEALKRSASAPAMALPLAEPPIFGPYAAIEIAKAKAFRNAIMEYLAKYRQVGQSEALARISVCTIGFGGVVCHDWVMPTLQACVDTFTLDGKLWFEIERKSGANGELIDFVRRPFDPLTACLVLQYRQRGFLTPKSVMDQDILRKETDRLLQSIHDGSGIPDLPVKTVDACRLMQTFFRFVLPGMLAGISDGRAQGYCLPRPEFVRVVGGVDTVPIPLLKPDTSSAVKPLDVVEHHGGFSLKQAKKLLGTVNEILLEALPPTAVGGKHGSEFQSKHADALKALESLSVPEACPSVVTLLLNWARCLFEEGGRRRRRLRPSSIRTYWHRVALPMIEFGLDNDFLEFVEEDFENFYTLVLDARSRRIRPQRARVLRDFHLRCGANLPKLDWHEIEPHIDLDQKSVDAQVVTPSEFNLGLSELSRQEEKRPDYALALGCSSILQYRGGLRLGDVLRLTQEDIRLNPGEVLIFVRRNRFGRPKTYAGRRIVRLAEPLLRPQERQKLEALIEFRKKQCSGDADAALFGPSSDGGELYDRRSFESDACDILRWATGRPDARTHHLRHSAGSYQMAAAIPPDIGSRIWQQVCEYFGSCQPDVAIRTYHLNDHRPSRRVVHAISQQFGHASPDSSFTYLHFLELGLARSLWESAPCRIDEINSLMRPGGDESKESNPIKTWRKSSYDLAQSLTGLSNADLRQLKSRGKDVGCLRNLAALMIKRFPVDHGVAVRAENRAVFSPKWAKSSWHLEHIHHALLAASEGALPEIMAQRSGLSAKVCSALAKTAARNSRRCAFRAYQSVKGKNVAILPVPSEGSGSDLYQKFDALLDMQYEPEILDGLEVWAGGYLNSISGLAVESTNDLRSALALTQALGIRPDRLRISIPRGWEARFREQMMKDLSGLEEAFGSIEFHHDADTKARSELPKINILLENALGTGNRSRNMKAFHQYCYLVWIASLARPILGAQ